MEKTTAAATRPVILDESAYRRPGCWGDGVDVVLADGQAWRLPRPLVRWVPSGDGLAEAYVKFGPGGPDTAAYGEALKAFEGDGPDWKGSALQLGRMLLLAYYDLAPEEVREVLQFSFDEDADPEGARIAREVLAVAQGRGPSLPKP